MRHHHQPEGQKEAALRQRLHSAGVRRLRRDAFHANARIAFWLAADLASSGLPLGDELGELKATLNNLAGLFKTARWIERTEAPDAE